MRPLSYYALNGDRRPLGEKSRWRERAFQVIGDEKRVAAWAFRNEVYPIEVDDSATFYSTTADAFVEAKATTWNSVHGATEGYFAKTNETIDTYGAAAYSETYYIRRLFFFFDTSSLGPGATVTAATFSIYASEACLHADSDVCAMKGTQADDVTTADFDSFSGEEYGHVDWTLNGYNDITLNAAGLSDIDTEGVTKICAREYSHDYLNVTCGTGKYRNGVIYADLDSTPPKLAITYTPAAGGSGAVGGLGPSAMGAALGLAAFGSRGAGGVRPF